MGLIGLCLEHQEILSSHQCAISPEDYALIAPKIESLKSIARLENRAIAVYDIHRRRFILKEDRHLELLGYGPEIDIDDIKRYHDLVSPNDLEFLYDSEIATYRYIKDQAIERKKDFKLIYDYRVRAKDGTYARFLHQLAVLELDAKGNSWLVIVLSDLLSRHAPDGRPRRLLVDIKTNKAVLFNAESGIKDHLVTDREREVLALIAQGLDSGDIARRLYISVNTVNNHRRHILEKTSTANIPEALSYLKLIGLI